MKLALLLLALAALAAAQTVVTPVVLTWTDAINPASVAYTIYRAPASTNNDCTTVTYTKLAGSLTAKTYTDFLTVAGPYCYAVTATLGKRESQKSAPLVYTLLAAPTGLDAQ